MKRAIVGSAVLVAAVVLLAGCGTPTLLKGNEAFLGGDYAAARDYWTPMAEAGNPSAQHNLGVLHRHLGQPARAAFWWDQATARGYVPSMLELAELMLAAGDRAEAENLYRLAARWGDRDAADALEQLDRPVPSADLLLAKLKRSHAGWGQAGNPVRRPDPNERLNRMLDEEAPVGGSN